MNPEEIDALMGETAPALVGVVGTIRADGSPHTVPVWYAWDGSIVRIWTDERRQWVRNITRDRRVAFSVQQPSRPFGAVLMRGHANLSVDGPDLHDQIRDICRRYLPAEEVEAYATTWSRLRTIVSIRPSVVRAWARGY